MATLTLFLESLSPNSPKHATVVLQRTSSFGLTGSFTQISFTPIERPEDDAASDFILVRSTLQNDATKSTLDVVIKATLLRRCEYEIALETKAYENHANALAGLIPEFHGLYVEGPNAIVQCLITQYCGEPLPTAFSLLPLGLRWKIVRQVLKMHEELGLHHLALFERNILREATTGNIYFIDLRMLRPHQCKRKLRIKAGCIHPSPDEVDYDELYKLVTKMQLWASNCVDFWGEPMFLHALGSAEDVMAMYPKYKITSEDQRKQMLVEAEVFLENVVIPLESPPITECLASEDVL
ncbi:hypothetical protein Hypma_001871 [Hypsizygus marmoreus]|uniref:Protein kinase domain-containing protein n=1 Tax=Hypsizygus marmoreus TaxID=39966 RepID=A0A369JAC9_HYPMA|nr:hypothetical protein Hypma_001871 [Hypsizygus marmoreus]